MEQPNKKLYRSPENIVVKNEPSLSPNRRTMKRPRRSKEKQFNSKELQQRSKEKQVNLNPPNKTPENIVVKKNFVKINQPEIMQYNYNENSIKTFLKTCVYSSGRFLQSK